MKYFKAYELVDKRTYEEMGENALSLFQPDALIMLDDYREWIGVPVTVNNWYYGGPFQWRGLRNPRCPQYSKGSLHTLGGAFDSDAKGYTAEQIRQKILADKDNALLKNIMRMEDAVNWLHMDIKPVQNRIYLFKA
jgi:hypothetical protein